MIAPSYNLMRHKKIHEKESCSRSQAPSSQPWKLNLLTCGYHHKEGSGPNLVDTAHTQLTWMPPTLVGFERHLTPPESLVILYEPEKSTRIPQSHVGSSNSRTTGYRKWSIALVQLAWAVVILATLTSRSTPAKSPIAWPRISTLRV